MTQSKNNEFSQFKHMMFLGFFGWIYHRLAPYLWMAPWPRGCHGSTQDVICGFPAEGAEDHRFSMDLVKEYLEEYHGAGNCFITSRSLEIPWFSIGKSSLFNLVPQDSGWWYIFWCIQMVVLVNSIWFYKATNIGDIYETRDRHLYLSELLEGEVRRLFRYLGNYLCFTRDS